jgi:hypothetical protein
MFKLLVFRLQQVPKPNLAQSNSVQLSNNNNKNPRFFNINDLYGQQQQVTMSANNNPKSRVAGYRIIRQIIPGPNSTEADIERAIARSQFVNTSSYMSQPAHHRQHHSQVPNNRVYSPYSDFNSLEFNNSNFLNQNIFLN